MVSMHLSSLAMLVVAKITVNFYHPTGLMSQNYKVSRLSNTYEKFYDRHTDLVGQYNKNVFHDQVFAYSTS